jgi:hypothetical protein
MKKIILGSLAAIALVTSLSASEQAAEVYVGGGVKGDKGVSLVGVNIYDSFPEYLIDYKINLEIDSDKGFKGEMVGSVDSFSWSNGIAWAYGGGGVEFVNRNGNTLIVNEGEKGEETITTIDSKETNIYGKAGVAAAMGYGSFEGLGSVYMKLGSSTAAFGTDLKIGLGGGMTLILNAEQRLLKDTHDGLYDQRSKTVTASLGYMF